MMRAAFLVLALAMAGCATPAPAPKAKPNLWDGYGSPRAQAQIRACLDHEREAGNLWACLSGGPELPPGVGPPPAPLKQPFRPLSMRQIYWMSIDNWETVMRESLSWLRANGSASAVDASQRKWEASMLQDVGHLMSFYEGGSAAGVTGARIRAQLVPPRVIFLEMWRAELEHGPEDNFPAGGDE